MLFTIGFAGKSEQQFWDLLAASGVQKIIDIRLWRAARFVPWANEENLYSAAVAHKIFYAVMSELAPTKELLNDYKNGAVLWMEYEQVFNKILATRQVEKLFFGSDLENVCFLCTEKLPDYCHRRLVAEYLARHFDNLEIQNLV
ncbi:MAG: DUF488 domain-containing protein [Rickettsiales bacterium]|nr:DUF488 domain-containing protein [Rickettsiales bacterium]